jgi:hypothetical protein
MKLRWLRWLSSAGGSIPDGVLPPVKSSSGRAWLAARALPRHASQVCTWASGECGSPPLPLPSLLWPLLLAIWPWIAAPSSQTWFCEAAYWCKYAVLDSISYCRADQWCSCCDQFSVRELFWQRSELNLALLQCSISSFYLPWLIMITVMPWQQSYMCV